MTQPQIQDFAIPSVSLFVKDKKALFSGNEIAIQKKNKLKKLLANFQKNPITWSKNPLVRQVDERNDE